MLSKEENYLYEKLLNRDYSHNYLMDNLDINPNHPMYSKYYNPDPKSLDERYVIQPLEINVNGCHIKLVDVCIRNNFYGTILISNSIEILEKEKEKLIKNIKSYTQLSLFEELETDDNY